jgi:hypothetical protein
MASFRYFTEHRIVVLCPYCDYWLLVLRLYFPDHRIIIYVIIVLTITMWFLRHHFTGLWTFVYLRDCADFCLVVLYCIWPLNLHSRYTLDLRCCGILCSAEW